ncbi:MAG: restriction endonuclease subunit S [Clostridium butyricum]|nr:restriction endonuclease subunit S [Clostridium butyricum]
MNKNKEKVPKIRFPGFTEPWEQRKFGELVNQVIREVDKPDKPYWRLSVRSHAKGTFHQFVDEPQKVAMDKLYVVHEDDLVVNITFAWEHAIAVASKEDTGMLVSHRFPMYRADGKSDIGFLKYLVSQEYFRRKMDLISPGGAGRNRVLSKSEFLKIEVVVPCNKEEQQKIGEYFSNLDNLITLHQRKLNHLKDKKKGLLQKMFPKKGELVPELRFPEFTDPWEQRKLGEIVDFLDEQRKPLESGKRESGPYPYYGASGIIDYVKDYIFYEELILLSEDGANIIDRNYRVCFLAQGKYWVNNHAHVLKAKKNYSNGFICESLERLNYDKYNTGTAQPKLNQEVCRNINIWVPKLDEQKKIFAVLNDHDNLITLHQRKLDHLKEQKKALLQQMFI